MAFLLRFSKNILSLKSVSNEVRTISFFPRLQIKEIKTVEDGKNTIISAEILPSPRGPYLLKNDNPNVCAICASGLDIKHTDVLILSQFLRNDGCMLPRRITQLCKTQHKRIATMVKMAQKAGLMPNMNPPSSKRDPKKRFGWKKFNKYFDESTIKWKIK